MRGHPNFKITHRLLTGGTYIGADYNSGVKGVNSWVTPFLSRTEVMVLESRERRERSLRSELEGNIVGLVNRLVGGLEVPLRALWCEARGGGGRLRHAT